MEIKKITKPLFFTNTYIITNNNESIVVDPGLNLSNNDFKNYNIKAILLTHGHIDHIASINLFNCPIYIYKDEIEFLSNNDLNLSDYFGIKYDYKNQTIKTFIDGEILNLIGLTFKVIHTPGHTSGSVCFLCEDILFSGDTLFQGSIGRTDFPTSSLDDMKISLSKLLKLDDKTKIYPGHGESSTIEFEKKYNLYV